MHAHLAADPALLKPPNGASVWTLCAVFSDRTLQEQVIFDNAVVTDWELAGYVERG